MSVFRCALVAVMLCTAGQAQALSCLRADAASTYLKAANSDAQYMVVLGRFLFDERALKTAAEDMQQSRHARQTPARFSGHYLTKAGFVFPWSSTIGLQADCAASWCGSLQSGAQTLAFVQTNGVDHTLHLSPCGDTTFVNPNAGDIGTVVACHKGRQCGSSTTR
ncbi:hypothetical protein [Nereida sp.]|uniref:hypothetical protein n=1 Tax=Nereida sp. TaxID=2736090 RepID=UPI003F695267